MNTTDNDRPIEIDGVNYTKPSELKVSKPTGKPTIEDVRAGRASFRDVEGPVHVAGDLALAGAADGLARGEMVHVNETTDSATERAVLAILGLSDKGKRVKGKGEKKLDVRGLTGDRILDSAIRRRWEKMPAAADVAEKIARTIAAEQRQTLPVACKDLYLAKNGALYLQGTKAVAEGNAPHDMTPTAYSQIAERAPGDIKKPLAYNLNAWCPTSDKQTRIRRLKGNTGPLAFAAVGPKYVEFDADQAVGALVKRLPAEAKARWTYRGDGGMWKIESSLARPVDVEGDLHEMGLWLKSSDDGRSGIQFGFAATRWTCSNTLRILHQTTAKRLRHVGNVARFLESFDEILGMAGDAFALFSKVWGEARDSHPVDRLTGESIDVAEAVARLCAARSTDRYRLNVPGVSAEVLAGRVMTSWEADPTDDVRGLVNAVTRASHEWQWSEWASDDLEDQAAELLYAKVIELPSFAAVGAQ
jgi:hypothetical protein